MNEINIAAAIILDKKQRLLLVRKKNTAYFMQAGGKIEKSETPTDCLIRELREELNITIAREELTYAGSFTANAANEIDHRVIAQLFILHTDFDAAPAAEIAEAVWVCPTDRHEYALAPLTRDYVFPLVQSRLAQPRAAAT